MNRSAEQLRADALAIWQAAVEAVRSDRLVRDALRVEEDELVIADELRLDLRDVRRIVVVGAGKAGAGMAEGVCQALGPSVAADHQLEGWVNVPADCVGAESRQHRIHLHAARPAGVNEPTEEGQRGSQEILRLVESLGPQDLCLCLISGGASALLPAPVNGVSLSDKLAVTRFLSAAGANIQELNTVRKQLSRIKGGGLMRACRAGWLVTLIISDVIGDPLDVIGSGPTVADSATRQDALSVLAKFDAQQSGLVPRTVYAALERSGSKAAASETNPSCGNVRNFVIGNNALAVDAAGLEAVRRGYSPAMSAAQTLEGPAEDVGRHLAEMAEMMREAVVAHDDHNGGMPTTDCLVSGGEPVVQLAPADRRGKGGRNQQLVLAALESLQNKDDESLKRMDGIVILSGGTDGEDGPTDAAGALADATIAAAAAEHGLQPGDFLRRNDTYHFFEPIDGLIKTGPTHTNVCDVRVVLVSK